MFPIVRIETFSDAIKDVHRRQKLTTDFFQTFRVDYLGCEYLNFEKKENAYRGFQRVIF